MPVVLKQVNNEMETWDSYKARVLFVKKRNAAIDELAEVSFARSFCFYVMKYLWKTIDIKNRWKCRELDIELISLEVDTLKLAKDIAKYLSELSIIECGYKIGNLYTLLLPNKYKAELGVYYTPPEIAERLLDILVAEGVNWAEDTILDPACGGGAFLVTVANRILGDHRIKCLSSEEKIIHIEKHLSGMEIDIFAGWLTQVLLDIITYSDSLNAGRRMKGVVRIQNTIEAALKEDKKYDLIVGNPPYGRITLDDDIRKIYARSLFGHANLYGLFIDASLRLKAPKGFIGFVTPTSFLGGQYFSNLRKVLIEEAPPLNIDFISNRSGVFDEVLQETCLAVFGENKRNEVSVNKINIENSGYRVQRIGTFDVGKGTNPWIIAREDSEAALINAIKEIKTTIKDYGYKVSTGPLVWNRLKDQLSETYEEGMYPIIWAEAIGNTGDFTFDYQNRKLKYLKLKEGQDFLLCKKPVVLVQRTTAKEQIRRVLTCVLPKNFLNQKGGVVVENHVNIVHAVSEPKISPEALSMILNTKIVDRIFRCISGSVAVSATELHALPLPPINKVKEIDNLINNTTKYRINNDLMNTVENIVTKAYGLGE